MEEEDKNPIIEEIEKEIQETIKSNDSEFEIEIAEERERYGMKMVIRTTRVNW